MILFVNFFFELLHIWLSESIHHYKVYNEPKQRIIRLNNVLVSSVTDACDPKRFSVGEIVANDLAVPNSNKDG